jgi:hypothetical protein
MPKSGYGRPLWFVLSRLAALAVLVLLPIALQAGWFGMIFSAAGNATRTARHSAAFEAVIQHVKALPARSDSVAVAAQATQEGHWRFVNRAGETFTAGTPDEMKRAVSLLFPESKASARPFVYITQDTIFSFPATVKLLPAAAEVFVVVGPESYRVLRRREGNAERFYAEVRSNLVIEMIDAQVFEETAWQLARPLNTAGVRVLAVEPGGPSTLSASPRLDPASKRALVDVIDPGSLLGAMGAASGQTLLLTGRIERELLYVKPSSGPDRSLVLKDLFRAADAADIDLVILHAASTPRQPGGRNWLWQRVEVSGLDEAMQRAHVADFLNGLGSAGRRLSVSAAPAGGRATLEIKAAADLPGAPAPGQIGEMFSGIVADMTGRVVVSGVLANLRSAQRQQELDRRLLPGVPSWAQLTYVLAVFVGLFGVPVSRQWWQRLWPPEVAAEYAGRSGIWAARAVRALAYVLVFLPLTAVAAAPQNLTTQIWEGVTGPARLWRWLTGRRGPAEPAATGEAAVATPSNSARDWSVLGTSALGQRPRDR